MPQGDDGLKKIIGIEIGIGGKVQGLGQVKGYDIPGWGHERVKISVYLKVRLSGFGNNIKKNLKKKKSFISGGNVHSLQLSV